MKPERLQDLRINSKNKASREIFDVFQKRYRLGTVGVVGACVIASLTVTNCKPVSLILVSPSGQMKSQIMRDLSLMFPKNSVMLESRFTPYGLSKRVGESNLNNKTWIVNDMVRTFDGLSQTKISDLVGWLTEIISEGKAGSTTANEYSMSARMNLLGSLAVVSYEELKRKFMSSTLNERILQFTYYVDKSVVREETRKQYRVGDAGLVKEFAPSVVEIREKDKKKSYEYADRLCVLGGYEKYSLRPDEMVVSLLSSHAKLNGRQKVNDSDFEFLDAIFPYFRRMI